MWNCIIGLTVFSMIGMMIERQLLLKFFLLISCMMFIDVMIILGTITLTISVNNVIVLINFLSILFIIGYELLGINCVEITLLIVIIYSSAFLCLFLMNGFMFMSSFYILYCVLSINSYFDNLFVCFPCIWSVFLEIGLSF